MTRVSWNDVGQRFYESGSDRGVLYLAGQDGVPWNGLIGVDENTSGGEPRAYYLDGYKYLNVAAAEEYAATIKAFTSPRAFDVCDGTTAIHRGLFATQQKRQNFGFTYRTLIGNDVDGLDHGYKLHLIYNALAGPAQRSYSTIGDDSSPMTLGWNVTTVPPIVPGIRPTAHFVIDSRLTPPRLMETIEGILYGTDTTASRLPTAVELADLFKSLPPIAATNIATNGSFELAAGSLQVRRNYNLNPRMINSIAGWNTTGAVATIAASSSGAQIDVTAASGNPLIYQVANIATATGDRWSASMEITVPAGFPAVTLDLRVHSYGDAVFVATAGYVTIQPGTTVTLTANSSLAIAAASTGIRTLLYGTGTPVGARFFVRNALAEKEILADRYFDGSTPPKLRRNYAKLPQPKVGNGWLSNDGSLYPRTWDATGGRRPGTGAVVFTRSAASPNTVIGSFYAVGMSAYNAANGVDVTPGEVITFSVYAKADVPYTARMVLSYRNETGASAATSAPVGNPTSTMAANSWVQVTQTVTIPAGVAIVYPGLNVNVPSGVTVGGEKVWSTDALVEKTSEVLDFFDPTISLPAGFAAAWEGVATSSISYVYDTDMAVSWTGTTDNSESILTGEGIGTYGSPPTVVRAIKSRRWVDTGTYSLRQIPAWSSRGSAYTALADFNAPRGLLPGGTYTVLISFYQEAPQNFVSSGKTQRAISLLGTVNASEDMWVQADNVAGAQIVKLILKIPVSGPWYLRLYNGGMFGDASVWWDNLTIVEGIYNGEAFNGDTPDTDIRIYDWAGLPDQSVSTMRTWYY